MAWLEEDDEGHAFDRCLVPDLFLFLSLDEVRDPTLQILLLPHTGTVFGLTKGPRPRSTHGHGAPTATEQAEFSTDENAKSLAKTRLSSL